MNSMLQSLVIWGTMGYIMAQYGMKYDTLGYWSLMVLIMLSEFISNRSARERGISEGVWNTMHLSPEEFLTCKTRFNKLNADLNGNKED